MDKIMVDSFVVTGKVQGVGFRYHTARQALELSLTGYAKNLDTGEVEVLAVGQAPQVEQLFIWLQQGPKTARVEQVTRHRVKLDKLPSSFHIL